MEQESGTWRDTLLPVGSGYLLWETLISEETSPFKFLAQRRKINTIGNIVTGTNRDPSFRIVTTVPNYLEIAHADTETSIRKLFSDLQNFILPQLEGIDSIDDKVKFFAAILKSLHHKSSMHELLDDWEMLDGTKENLNEESLTAVTVFAYDYVLPAEELRLRGIPFCASCNTPPIEPRLLSSASSNPQYLCKICYAFELQKNPSKSKETSEPSQYIKDSLDDLAVFCPFRVYGCDNTPRRVDVANHAQHCSYALYECSYRPNGCEFSTKDRKEITNHVLGCSYREKPMRDHCGNCGQHVTKEAVESTCKFHPGKWSGYSFGEVVANNYGVKASRIVDGSRVALAVPRTAIVGAAQSLQLVAGLPFFYFAASSMPFIDVYLAETTGVVLSRVVSLLWFNPATFLGSVAALGAMLGIYRGVTTNVARWTCCSQSGAFAEPCEERPSHHIVQLKE